MIKSLFSFFIFCLLSTTAFAGQLGIPDAINFAVSGGQLYTVPRTVAGQFGTIAHMLDDLPNSTATIPLNEINGGTLAHLLGLLVHKNKSAFVSSASRVSAYQLALTLCAADYLNTKDYEDPVAPEDSFSRIYQLGQVLADKLRLPPTDQTSKDDQRAAKRLLDPKGGEAKKSVFNALLAPQLSLKFTQAFRDWPDNPLNLPRVEVSPDGLHIAVVTHNHDNPESLHSDPQRLLNSAVALLKCPTGEELRLFPSMDQVHAAHFSSDGQLLASASSDGTVQIWDVQTGKRLKMLQHMFQHDKGIKKVRFNHDNSKVVTVSLDKTSQVFDVASGDCLGTLIGQRRVFQGLARDYDSVEDLVDARFSAHDLYILTRSCLCTLNMWQGRAPFRFLYTLMSDGQKHPVNYAEFSTDGSKVLTTSVELNRVDLWESETGNNLLKIERQQVPPVLDPQVPPVVDPRTKFRIARLSPNGSSILTVHSPDPKAQVWNAQTGTLIADLNTSNVVCDVNFSPDGKRIITTSEDGKVLIWDSATQKLLFQVSHQEEEEEEDQVEKLRRGNFSPDGNYFVTISDTHAWIWKSPVPALLEELISDNDSPDDIYQLSIDEMRAFMDPKKAFPRTAQELAAAVAALQREDDAAPIQQEGGAARAGIEEGHAAGASGAAG